MADDWRGFREQDWEQVRQYALGLLYHRESVGRRNYRFGSFHGDPLAHLEDELADALVYAYFARRERESLETRLAKFESGERTDG